MRSQTYNPCPIDTAAVSLDDFGELIEQLAKNAHEVWSAKRIAEGWVHGPSRDDVRKLHPSLVSYDQLPESEKDYDRKIVSETLKALVTLGYVIARK